MICLISIIISLLILVAEFFTKIKSTGLYNYLPNIIKHLLMERSLFDVLCDIWYSKLIPMIKGYFIYLILTIKRIF